MGDGAENRSRLKRHVRAAREWLGHAEDSLDRREDVRGDLDLMLASAELARARETETPGGSVVWARRLLPLAAAMILAGSGWLLWRGSEPQPPPPVDREAAGMVLPMPPPSAKGAEEIVATAPVEPPKAMPEEPVAIGTAAEPETASADGFETPAAPVETAEPIPDTEPSPIQAARVPSEELQRWMSRAGQRLRAQ